MTNIKSKHALFHHLLEEFRKQKIQKSHLLVGVSGGMDSITLLASLLELSQLLTLKISVVHVIHGAQTEKQKTFQKLAQKTVCDFCNKNACDFYENDWAKTPKTRQNEAQMRDYRYKIFSKYLLQSKADFLTLAHSEEDLLETRLIRLIRGTGEQGLLAMSFKKAGILRPFIHVNRTQIQDYATHNKLKWQEDPSNQSPEYSLRNWIRKKWLPQLEATRPGSVKTLSRSLDLLAHSHQDPQEKWEKISQNLIKNQSLKRELPFSIEAQKKILAYYFKKQGFKNYRATHISELLKQMSRPQKRFSFSLLGKKWKMGPEWLAPSEKIC